MVHVFVNGNPETPAIWGPLLERLELDDATTPAPPGFGAPIPAGFACTVAGYREWLVHELEHLEGPVDLVGHDIGGSTVIGVAMTRPDLLRSWASDSIGVFDPEYRWHGLAQQWQTPGAGERSVAELMGGTVGSRAERLRGMGVPDPIADEVAAAQGEEMGRAILSFYRSAAQPVMADLGRDLPHAARVPGLAILATDDEFVGSLPLRHRAAERAGARVQELEGCGHLWMVEEPADAAHALSTFWAGVS